MATDLERLQELKQVSAGAEWEPCPGATDAPSALEQLGTERPHRLVAFGPFEELIAQARDRFPALQIVSDRTAPGAVVATSMNDVRAILDQMPRPGGPVR